MTIYRTGQFKSNLGNSIIVTNIRVIIYYGPVRLNH